MSARKPIGFLNIKTKGNNHTNTVSNSSVANVKLLKTAPAPSSIGHIILMVILQFCRKIIFFDTKLRICIYLMCLFAVSGLADILPVPKSYFFSTNNFLNTYFVKLGWFWTLFVSLPFVYFTSYTYCCGKKDMVLKHLSRLLVATFNWYIWVNFFIYFESNYGTCMDKDVSSKKYIDLNNKSICHLKGHRWNGFDLSGHTFILLYSTLLLIEEARPITGWEGIQDIIRDEIHSRTNSPGSFSPLRTLSIFEFSKLQPTYKKFLPWVRFYFILITMLTIVWDIMLFSTILYFHSMPEKLLSGFIAIFLWYFTYYIWYKTPNMLPYPPGEGLFKYSSENKPIVKRASETNRRGSASTFMGMPIASKNNNTLASS